MMTVGAGRFADGGERCDVTPLEHASAQPFAQEPALQEERNDPLAEAGAHALRVDLPDVDEPALLVKASLREQAMPAGMEPAKRSRALENTTAAMRAGLPAASVVKSRTNS